MEHISQKVSRLKSIRNGFIFRPVFDSHGVSPLMTYVRLRSSSNGDILCVEESWDPTPIYLPSDLLVRRVIETE